MIATMATVAGVGTVIVAVAASIMASELHACGPRFARWITRRAALWLPEDERTDYIDENDNHTDEFGDEGLNVTAVTQAVVSWASTVQHGGIHAWAWRDATEQRLQGLIFGGLIFGLNTGLIGGLLTELTFGLIYGLTFGLGAGLAFGLGVELSAGLRARLTLGLTFGLSFGLNFGLRFGLIYGLTFGLGVGLTGGLIYGLGPSVAVRGGRRLTLWLRGRSF